MENEFNQSSSVLTDKFVEENKYFDPTFSNKFDKSLVKNGNKINNQNIRN